MPVKTVHRYDYELKVRNRTYGTLKELCEAEGVSMYRARMLLVAGRGDEIGLPDPAKERQALAERLGLHPSTVEKAEAEGRLDRLGEREWKPGAKPVKMLGAEWPTRIAMARDIGWPVHRVSKALNRGTPAEKRDLERAVRSWKKNRTTRKGRA